MRWRVYIETYDHELKNALEQLNRKKGKYLHMALEHYYYSKEGRIAFKDMVGEQLASTKEIEKKVVKKKKKDVFNIDEFLN